MSLKLERPLIFFDLETTGIDVANDRIVEISVLKVFPDGSKELKTRRINPEMPIPPASTAVHGITDDDVADCPSFKQIAKNLAAFFQGADLAGYNLLRFDLPLLMEEFMRVSVPIDLDDRRVVDVQVIFHAREPRTLSAAYKYYCGKHLDNAHSAEADTVATYEILLGQLEKYEDLEKDVDALSKLSKGHRKNVDLMGLLVHDENGEEIINFGKFKGQKAEDVLRTEPSYLSWILGADFPAYTKMKFQSIAKRLAGKNHNL